MKAQIKWLILGAIAVAAVVQYKRGNVSLFSDGIKLNNPGKLPYNQNIPAWPNETRPSSSTQYAQFPDPVWGLYALAKRLSIIMANPGDRTLTRIISAWAVERNENPSTYVAAIAKRTELQTGSNIANSMPEVMKAIIDYENGEQPYANLIVVNSWRMTQLNTW